MFSMPTVCILNSWFHVSLLLVYMPEFVHAVLMPFCDAIRLNESIVVNISKLKQAKMCKIFTNICLVNLNAQIYYTLY